VTVGVTAATSVVVMNARITAERHQPDLGDDGRATAVTISDTEQTGRGGGGRRHGGDQSRGGERQDDHGGDAQHVAGDVVVTTDGAGILTDGFTL
jgi:hypothetical protein